MNLDLFKNIAEQIKKNEIVFAEFKCFSKNIDFYVNL